MDTATVAQRGGESYGCVAEREIAEERKRRIVAFCSGPRVDKQHPGNWSVNIVSD